MGLWLSRQRNLHQPVCPDANTELAIVLLTAVTEREEEEEETAKERESWSFLDIGGTGHRDHCAAEASQGKRSY